MANAAGADRRQAVHGNGAVSGEPVFVAPEPQQHAIEIRRQVFAERRVAVVECAEQLVMRQHDDGALIGAVRENDRSEPLHDVVMQVDPGKPELFDQREDTGVVAAIETQNPPVAILQAEVARFLVQRAQRRLEVALSTGIHLVIGIHREGVLGSARPILVAQEPVLVFLRCAAEVHIAQVNRHGRFTVFEPLGHFVSGTGAGPPIRGEPDGHAVWNPENAVAGAIPFERVTLMEHHAEVMRDPRNPVVREELPGALRRGILVGMPERV